MPKGQTLQQRFDSRVNKTESCWIWTGTRDGDGYGVIWTQERNNNERAHRVSLRLSGVYVPDNLMVLHSCDNPWCVNPEHLSLGNNQQNQIEARDRGLLGDLTSKRQQFFKKMTDEEFLNWSNRFKDKEGKALGNLRAAQKWRNETK